MTYEEMLALMADRYEQTPETLEELMNIIAFHETGPQQRMQSDAMQIGGGPGQGLFQFEAGPNQGGATAMQRLRNFLMFAEEGPKLSQDMLPAFTNFDRKKGVEAAMLTPEQQKMMLLADYREKLGASLKGVTPETLPEFYQDYHYAGDENRIPAFKESMDAYFNQKTVDGVIDSPEDAAFDMGTMPQAY